ncbi:hypothetical protein OH76DRAFT_695292 [Lentinus brumalis]|uniref:Uncharacterized protein n=1 Tax=Lentinus brumalis TaxID=2498619 RepID=A0A371D682_9APHY|nr:hypothetical protein OH76DRAFT_695292 [Polyporus brumalis]
MTMPCMTPCTVWFGPSTRAGGLCRCGFEPPFSTTSLPRLPPLLPRLSDSSAYPDQLRANSVAYGSSDKLPAAAVRESSTYLHYRCRQHIPPQSVRRNGLAERPQDGQVSGHPDEKLMKGTGRPR